MTLPIEKAQIAKTAAQWTALNPVLALDVIGIEVMTNGYNRYKRGDGSTTWNSLSYIDKVYSDQAVTAVTSVNNQTGAVTLDAADVGALPSTTAIPEQRCYYGTCSTDSNFTAKVVSCDGFTLTRGSRIAVRFANGNTATTMTLNVNSTGAETVCLKDSITLTGLTFPDYSVINFVYDGSYWRVENNYVVEAYNASNAVTLGGSLPSAFAPAIASPVSGWSYGTNVSAYTADVATTFSKMGNFVYISALLNFTSSRPAYTSLFILPSTLQPNTLRVGSIQSYKGTDSYSCIVARSYIYSDATIPAGQWAISFGYFI